MIPGEASAEYRIQRGAAGYPPLLDVIPDPPERLHIRGESAVLLGARAVAIVGARKATGLGLVMAKSLGAALGRAGVVVVSGCAVGIDGSAHLGALEVGGPTVAVLGGGLDVAAPAANRGLAERIAGQGCLVGEYLPGTPPLRHHFPRRNRIIAGLARIVVVVEARRHSGALITARLALAAGREVMAVPGHPLAGPAEGSNGLLADGARMVLSPADVLDELDALPPLADLPLTMADAASPTEAPRADAPPAADRAADGPPVAATLLPGGLQGRLLAALSAAPDTAEGLAAAARAPLPQVLAALTELQLQGLADARPGGRFARPEPAAKTSSGTRQRGAATL